MKVTRGLLLFVLTNMFVGGLSVTDEENVMPEYQYNGVTYMSMQADDGSMMDTVWALEVETASSSLFDLVVSPVPKRISVKALTEFDSREWIAVWNRKLQALDMNKGLKQAKYAESFSVVTDYLPETLGVGDQFSIESIAGSQMTLSLNGQKLATIDSDNAFNFWMSTWISAEHAGVYADGSMLAEGDIESYLVDLLADEAPSLNPSLISSVF